MTRFHRLTLTPLTISRLSLFCGTTATLNRTVRNLGIALLTIGLLALFLWNSDLKRVGELILSVHPAWLGAGLLANLGALFCRAARWRLILDPDDPPRFYPTFFATAIGFMSSAVLPIRAGDVVRPALLTRRTSIRFSSALGTVLTERILDLTSILVLFLSFVLISLFSASRFDAGHRLFLRSAGLGAALIFALLILFIGALSFFRSAVRRMHSALARFVPARFRASWMNLFDSFSHSLVVLRRGRTFIPVLGFTVCIWTALTSQFYFVMLAFGNPLPYRASFLVTAMSILGFMIPTPGGVGGFHKAVQLVLVGFYRIGVDESVAVALLLHLVGTLPVLLTGAVLFVREGLTIRQLEEIVEDEPETMAE